MGVTIHHNVDGKIIQIWDVGYGLLQQIKIVPSWEKLTRQ
jgi:hypothetical protein